MGEVQTYFDCSNPFQEICSGGLDILKAVVKK